MENLNACVAAVHFFFRPSVDVLYPRVSATQGKKIRDRKAGTRPITPDDAAPKIEKQKREKRSMIPDEPIEHNEPQSPRLRVLGAGGL